MSTTHPTCTLNRCQILLNGLESGRDKISEPRGARRLMRVMKRSARFILWPAHHSQGDIARAHQIQSRAHRIASGRR